MPASRPLLELCTEDLEGVIAADAVGLDRVEFCAAFSEGGITVSLGLAREVLRTARRVGVRFLIRARPGDFVYSAAEVRAMAADIAAFREIPHRPQVSVGFAIGALTADRRLDLETLRVLTGAAAGAPLTFHRAFDLIDDRADALETLVQLGFDRVLTSGGAVTALDGADALAALVEQAAGRIVILAAGGIRPHNIAQLLQASAVPEAHFALRTTVSHTTERSPTLSLVGTPVATDLATAPDREAIESLLKAVDWACLPATGRKA